MKRALAQFSLLIISVISFAQGSVDDYKRAYSLQDRVKDKVFYFNVTPQWIGNTHKFWYIRNTPMGKTYVIIDADKKQRIGLFDHDSLTLALRKATRRDYKSNKLSLPSLSVTPKLDSIRFVLLDSNWVYCTETNRLINEGAHTTSPSEYWGKVDNERIGQPVTSPDKLREAFIRDNNVCVKELKSGEVKTLSRDGSPKDYYSVYLTWSPDSKKLAAMCIQFPTTRQLTMIESSPSDQLQPKLQTRDYRKPGDSLPVRTPVIFDLEKGTQHIAKNDLFAQQFELKGFEWFADSRSVLMEYNQRGHQIYRILEMSAETGEVKTLIEESSKTFVNYSRNFRQNIAGGHEIIWMSERDNWNHLYLYNRHTGKVKNQITKGEWYVREVLNVDEKRREITFSANGIVKGEDPYLIRDYRIRFDGSGLTCLTPEEGNHQAWFSEDKNYLVDVYSTVNKAPVTVLRNAKDGSVAMPLEKADIAELLKTGWQAPEPFVAKGRDGKTDMWGIIIRPSNFDPTKKYPVLEYIYAGPGSQYTPKSFFSFNRYLSSIAELGFIVVQLDAMGTSFRSKSFEDIIYKNLKDAGFPDRIAWTKAAAAKYPYMDIDRVGIFGASAGGQEAMWATLFHPEHYKAAYSACGCHDNRMDKIWWNEQWMSYPIGPEYAACSNVDNAHLLTRPLMLVVGELDDNVDPSSTMQVANALIKANKEFELVVLPSVGHTMGGDYGEHKRFDFFVKNLMGITPPAWELVNGKK